MKRAGALARPGDPRAEVILQILADAGQVMQRDDADRFEMVGGTNARQHENLRRVEGAGAENDLARGMCLLQPA